MPRLRLAVLPALLATPLVLTAAQAADAFRVSKAPIADVQQDTLQAVNPQSQQTTEVFPGTFQSPLGAAVMSRVQVLMGRTDEADRNALIAAKAGTGFDRSILRWRARPDGRTVAVASRYYRDSLFRLELEMTDDYGRADPVDPARYEFFGIAICSRGDGGWSCREEPLADVAARHNLKPPQDRAERIATAEQLVERVLAGK